MDYSSLESGDIVINSTSTILGKIIKFFSFDKFSHVNVFLWMKNVDGKLIVMENNNDPESVLYILDTDYGFIKSKYGLFPYREHLDTTNCFIVRKISKKLRERIDMCKFLENYIEKIKDKYFYDYNIGTIFSKITNMGTNRVDEKTTFMCVDFVEKYLRDLFYELEGYKPDNLKVFAVSTFTKNDDEIFEYFFKDSEPLYLVQKKTLNYGNLLFSIFFTIIIIILIKLTKE